MPMPGRQSTAAELTHGAAAGEAGNLGGVDR